MIDSLNASQNEIFDVLIKSVIEYNYLEKKNLNHPPPPPHLYPNHRAPDVFLSLQFPLLNIENRP